MKWVRSIEDELLWTHSARLGRVPVLRPMMSRRMHVKGWRKLASSPATSAGTPTSVRVNAALASVGGDRYLEIGLEAGLTLESVRAQAVVGVDPKHRVNLFDLPPHIEIHTMGSDDFFRKCFDDARGPTTDFDVVFVDGLHTFEQSYRDVVNSFGVLSDGGLVIVDDTVPSSSFAAIPDQKESKRARKQHGVLETDWMGDVFRTILALHRFHPDIAIATVVDDEHRGQTFLWRVSRREHPKQGLVPASRDDLQELHEISFEAVFGSGIPAAFNRTTLDEALAAHRRANALP